MEGQLELDVAAPRLVKVTPARLGVWADCPRRYRMTYLDRPSRRGGGAMAASTLGAVVHLALRALFGLPAPERVPSAAAALVDRYWNAEGFRDREQATRYRHRARGWVADYVTDTAGRDGEPVGLERWVSVGTARILAEGRVDRIDRRGGRLVVVDYKTGRAPTVEQARTSQALALYAMATEATLHRHCTRVELHHLPSRTVLAWEHDAASLARHRRHAERAAAETADAAAALGGGGDPDVLFPARPAARCGGCDLRRHCVPGRAAGPEREPWASLVP